ncbi:MAG: hypothetical protein ABSF93_20560, partial [Candidatus Sulfotelmatobacter sp.]
DKVTGLSKLFHVLVIMRTISLFNPMRSVEFRYELSLEAAAGLFQPSFSPRYVSQQCVQLLGTQN